MRHYSVQPHLIKIEPIFRVLAFSPHKVELHQLSPGDIGISGQQAIAKPFLGLCQRFGKPWKPNIILFQDTD